MSAILKSIDDPRTSIERARRETELIPFARRNGITHIAVAGMNIPVNQLPAETIRQHLVARGLTNIKIGDRPLGMPSGSKTPSVSEKVNTVDATTDLNLQVAAQFAAEQAAALAASAAVPAVDDKAIDAMGIIELGKKLKDLGLHRDRRDNMITMRAKIKAKLHGQDAA